MWWMLHDSAFVFDLCSLFACETSASKRVTRRRTRRPCCLWPEKAHRSSRWFFRCSRDRLRPPPAVSCRKRRSCAATPPPWFQRRPSGRLARQAPRPSISETRYSTAAVLPPRKPGQGCSSICRLRYLLAMVMAVLRLQYVVTLFVCVLCCCWSKQSDRVPCSVIFREQHHLDSSAVVLLVAPCSLCTCYLNGGRGSSLLCEGVFIAGHFIMLVCRLCPVCCAPLRVAQLAVLGGLWGG